MTTKVAAAQLGVSRDLVTRAADAGKIVASRRLFGQRRLALYVKREVVEDVAQRRTQWISHADACQRLSVSPGVLESLIRCGLIEEDKAWRGDLFKGGPVSQLSIAKLESQLRSHPFIA